MSTAAVTLAHLSLMSTARVTAAFIKFLQAQKDIESEEVDGKFRKVYECFS